MHLTFAVLALLIVLVSTVVRIVVWQRMEHSVEQTLQAGDIESRLDTTFSLMQDAETGQRGFLLTGLAPYLEPYERAVRELPAHFAQLEEMLTVRKDAGYVFSECKAASEEQLAGLAQTLQLYQAQGLPAAMKVMAAGEGNPGL